MYKTIAFGGWHPDIPPFDNPGVVVATNVFSDANAYQPFPNDIAYALAITARCQGSGVIRDLSSSGQHFVGDRGSLYKLQTTGSWSNVSRTVGGSYSTGTTDVWEFAPWGNTMIAVNGIDAPQRISLGAANFVVLPGAPPRAKHIATVRDFVVLGNISATATLPQTVQWSAINNSDSWTADAATLADRQDLPGTGGKIQKIIGGEYGTIFQERAIFRMTFVGSPLVFQFDQIHNNIGALTPNAVVAYQNLIYFYSENGFYVFDGVNLKPIGVGKVDTYFRNSIDRTALHLMVGVVLPERKLVGWAYRSDLGGSLVCDQMLLYNWETEKWTLVDGLDMELLTTLYIDSSGYPEEFLGAFNASHVLRRYRFVSGIAATRDVTLTTGDLQLNPDPEGRACITRVFPIVEGISATARITMKTRDTLGQSSSAGAAISVISGNFAPVRSSAKFHRIQIDVSGSSGAGLNTKPLSLQGLHIEYHLEGER